jgi:hypothetical protein
LQHLIQKDVSQRFTAVQAFQHPWIQECGNLSE